MTVSEWLTHAGSFVPLTVIIGIILISGFFAGRSIHKIKLPVILGYMLTGVIIGPSFLNIASEEVQNHLDSFVQITLTLVALHIGLELKITDLRALGKSIWVIIFSESFFAFVGTAGLVFLFTDNIPLAILAGGVAPASAPAGTVAVIQEYKASGKLTKSLYAVIGFDDGLAIIIFGFALAFVHYFFSSSALHTSSDTVALIIKPLGEIGLCFVLGVAFATVFYFMSSKTSSSPDMFALTIAFILISNYICVLTKSSIILTNMITGLILGNLKRKRIRENLEGPLKEMMPFLYILFFVLAGAHLEISRLSSISVLGIVYVVGRLLGLMGGAWFGGYWYSSTYFVKYPRGRYNLRFKKEE